MIQRVLQRGDLVLAVIPFTDLAATKIRPALIISDGLIGQDVVLAAISSVNRGVVAHDVSVESNHPEFAQTGLLKSSVVRCHHLITVEAKMLVRRLGTLPLSWQQQVDQELKQLLGLSGP